MQIDTSSDSIKGKYAIDKEGKVVWVDGAIVQAMKNGEMLVIEEINFIQPEVSSTIYSATDYRRNITLDEKEHEVVRAHPNFRIVATRNPDYQGTNRLNPALENRFTVQFFIDYLNWENESKLLQSRYGVGKEDAELLCKTASKLRQMREEFDNDLSTRVVEACARRVQAGTPMKKAIEMTISPIVAKDKENKTKVSAIFDTLVRESDLQKKAKVKA
jgi:MoxR-like ATPase